MILLTLCFLMVTIWPPVSWHSLKTSLSSLLVSEAFPVSSQVPRPISCRLMLLLSWSTTRQQPWCTWPRSRSRLRRPSTIWTEPTMSNTSKSLILSWWPLHSHVSHSFLLCVLICCLWFLLLPNPFFPLHSSVILKRVSCHTSVSHQFKSQIFI